MMEMVRLPSLVSLLNATNGVVTLSFPAGIVTVFANCRSSPFALSVTVSGLVVASLRLTVSVAPVLSPSRIVVLFEVTLSVGPSLSRMVMVSLTTVCLSPIAEQPQSVMYIAALNFTLRVPSTFWLSFTPMGNVTSSVPSGMVIGVV